MEVRHVGDAGGKAVGDDLGAVELTHLRDAHQFGETAGPAHAWLYQRDTSGLKPFTNFPSTRRELGSTDADRRHRRETGVAVEVIVDKLQGSLAAEVSELGLERLTLRLADAVVVYRETVNGDNGNVLYTQVATAHRRGLDFLAELLCMVMGVFHDSDNRDHMAARTEFLTPLMEHDRLAACGKTHSCRQRAPAVISSRAAVSSVAQSGHGQ
jgi:hypothetical protein